MQYVKVKAWNISILKSICVLDLPILLIEGAAKLEMDKTSQT